MALPVVLFLYSLVSRFGSAGDVQACLADLAAALDAMEGTVENKVAKASAMLANAADDLRGHVGKARGSVARARQEQGSLAGESPVSIGAGVTPGSISGPGVEGRASLVGLPP
jgi:hypothetical protein